MLPYLNYVFWLSGVKYKIQIIKARLKKMLIFDSVLQLLR